MYSPRETDFTPQMKYWKALYGRMVIMACITGPILATTMATSEASCDAPVNAIEAENCLTGNPESEWDLPNRDAGDLTIQGFSTDISVNKGQTVHFKINTPASNYTINIYRLGYYGGNGARKVATISPSAALPQTQPSCITDSATGLIDCGNWAESASWTVPASAVSGAYIARLQRSDTGGASHIVFVVRDDASHSDVLFQTSDTTWQAYNSYGGNSFYVGNGSVGRAFKVSYNRPIISRTAYSNEVLAHEYPMIRWLESNAYDVTYFTGVDGDRRGSQILNHKLFLSVGHDEYWSPNQRTAVENAQTAGVNTAFLSGNEIYWKTRWENSIDGSNTARRTLVCYKESYESRPVDPLDPPTWTGTWRDPRFSPPADGGKPENKVIGQFYTVDAYRQDALVVSDKDGKMRFWRNSAAATQAAGASLTFPELVGYEWDEDVDNPTRPAGIIYLSSETYFVDSHTTNPTGTIYSPGWATHHLTLFKHASGALVFAAGSMQWPWGLDDHHDEGSRFPPVPSIRQATVNLFADMGIQPGSLQPGLVPATKSTDQTPPISAITSPGNGDTVAVGSLFTISGTAADSGGRVGAVEVSVDNGNTWHPATGREQWVYGWTPTGTGSVTIKSRAVDDSLNMETAQAGIVVNVGNGNGPVTYTIWPATTTPFTQSQDPNPLEIGVRFRSDISGLISGIRFYKQSFNTGPHIGNLWTKAGVLLASATFVSETASGWQQVNFATPISINANTTYIASYFTTKGYAVNQNYFTSVGVDNPPLHALKSGVDGLNGLYHYGSTSAFPTNSYVQSNYWIDVAFTTSTAPPSNPVPTLTNLVPNSATAGGPAFTLTVTGTNFISNSVVRWNGSNRSTTFVNGTSLTAAIPASDIASTGTVAVTIFNPAPGGGVSTAKTFTVNGTNPVPTLLTLSPSTVTAGGAGFTLTVTGTNFISNSIVRWNGANRSTTFVNGSTLTAAIPSSDIASTGTVAIAIFNPAPGGGLSNTQNLTIVPAGPSVLYTIWSPSTLPGTFSRDPNPLEVGVRFRSDIPGYIRGIRFYKNSFNTSSHIGNLWTNTGVLLASVTFSGETASGWQQINFSHAIAISSNTTYVASYFTRTGYAVDQKYFTTTGIDNAPLHAPRSVTGNLNGLYHYGSTSAFPNNSYNQSNYWIDVAFSTSSDSGDLGGLSVVELPPNQTAATNLAVATTFRVFPNPWRANLHAGHDITFDGLAENTTVRIFTLSAQHVRTLSANGGSAPWDRTNDSGELVSSGFYLYLITGNGEKKTGKLAIIR